MMDMTQTILVMLAGMVFGILVLYGSRRKPTVKRGKERTLLGLAIPEMGTPGTASEAERDALAKRGIIAPSDTWLSHEQAVMLLDCARFAEAVWHERCEQRGAMPKEAQKATLEVFLAHESYRTNAAMMGHRTRAAQGGSSLPNDGSTRHLALVLSPFAQGDPIPQGASLA